MTTVHYKGQPAKTRTIGGAQDTHPRPADTPAHPPTPKVVWPPKAKPKHPRDRLADQLKAKPTRAKEVKRVKPWLNDEDHVARLMDIITKRGENVIQQEIDTHERKLALLREALRRSRGLPKEDA